MILLPPTLRAHARHRGLARLFFAEKEEIGLEPEISGRVCAMLSVLIRPIGNTDSGAMRRLLAEHLKKFDRVFDAEDMQILGAAFDSAWEAIQASGVRYPEDKVELVRAILAKHIIAAAKDGERDHSRLRDGALLALAQSNLRSPLR